MDIGFSFNFVEVERRERERCSESLENSDVANVSGVV